MNEAKTVHRYPPCPDYDVEAMESWLSDMAAKGLVLSRDGFFFGFGIFEKTEPKIMRYRLEASKNKSGTLNEFAPPEEAQEFYEAMGWQYVAARGNFHIYCTDDPEAREPHTDQQVQALTIDTVRKRIRSDAIIEVLWLLVIFVLRLKMHTGGIHLLLAIVALGTPTAALLLAVLCWNISEIVRRFIWLGRLKKRVKNGEGPDHGKDWRRGKPRYIAGIIINWLLTLILLGALFSSCAAAVDNRNEIPLDEFEGELPFATMAELLPGSSFERDGTSLGYQLNTVEDYSDFFAPVAIEFNENGDITAPDGTKLSGGLGVDYVEARNRWLAKEMFREFHADAKRSKRHREIELSLPGVERCEAYMDVFTTVLIRKGNIVLRADFYQYGDLKLSLEQWAGALAESIG